MSYHQSDESERRQFQERQVKTQQNLLAWLTYYDCEIAHLNVLIQSETGFTKLSELYSERDELLRARDDVYVRLIAT